MKMFGFSLVFCPITDIFILADKLKIRVSH